MPLAYTDLFAKFVNGKVTKNTPPLQKFWPQAVYIWSTEMFSKKHQKSESNELVGSN